jgi:FkbM family methyltransferase
VIFDVGSNNGQYLYLLLQNLKKLEPTIHCFEPEKSAFDDLKHHFGDYPNVILNNFALGNKKDKLILFSEASGDVKSSFVDIGDDNLMKKQYEIEITTLDNYCEEKNITKINFLKIDVEGFETNVVIGSERMIKNNGIERIQLEHGSTHSVVMGASLYNFKKLLVDYGMYHIKQNGIRKIKYTTQMEIFFNSNYYFKKKNID